MKLPKLLHKAITKSFSLLTNADRAKVEEGDFLETSGVFNTLEEIVAMRDFGSQHLYGITRPYPFDPPPLQGVIVTGSEWTTDSYFTVLDADTGEETAVHETGGLGNIKDIAIDGSTNIIAILTKSGETFSGYVGKWNSLFQLQWIKNIPTNDPMGLAVDREGNIWVGAELDNRLWKLSGATGEILIDPLSLESSDLHTAALPRRYRQSLSSDYLNRIHSTSWRFYPKPEGTLLSWDQAGNFIAKTYAGGDLGDKNYITGADGISWGTRGPLFQHGFRFSGVSFDPLTGRLVNSIRSGGSQLFRFFQNWKHITRVPEEVHPDGVPAWVEARRTPRVFHQSGDIIKSNQLARMRRLPDGYYLARIQRGSWQFPGDEPVNHPLMVVRPDLNISSWFSAPGAILDRSYCIDRNSNLFIHVSDDGHKIRRYNYKGSGQYELAWEYNYGSSSPAGLVHPIGEFGTFPERFLDPLYLWLIDILDFGVFIETSEGVENKEIGFVNYGDTSINVSFSVIGADADRFNIGSETNVVLNSKETENVSINADIGTAGDYEATLRATVDGVNFDLPVNLLVFANVVFGHNNQPDIRVRALSADTGNEILLSPEYTGLGIVQGISVDPFGDIFAVTSTGRCLKFRRTNLNLVWNTNELGTIDTNSFPSVASDHDGNAIVVFNNQIFKINGEDGATIWGWTDDGDYSAYIRKPGNAHSVCVTPEGDIYNFRNTGSVSTAGVIDLVDRFGQLQGQILNTISRHFSGIDYDPQTDLVFTRTQDGEMQISLSTLAEITDSFFSITGSDGANIIVNINLSINTAIGDRLMAMDELWVGEIDGGVNADNSRAGLTIDPQGKIYCTVSPTSGQYQLVKVPPDYSSAVFTGQQFTSSDYGHSIAHIMGRRSTFPERFDTISNYKSVKLYETDFSEYDNTNTLPLNPNEWTRHNGADNEFAIEADATFTGGKVLKHNHTGTSQLPFLTRNIHSFTNGVIITRFKTSTVDTNTRIWLPFRMVDGDNTYYLDIRSAIFQFSRLSSGAFDPVGTTNSASLISSDTVYWVKILIIDYTFQAKIWADGDPEPFDWEVRRTDTNELFASGLTGIGGRGGLTIWDYIEVQSIEAV